MVPQHMLPLRVRVDLGIMAIKEYSIFSKAPELEPHNQMQFCVICWTLIGVGVLPLAENQSVYSIAPLVDCADLPRETEKIVEKT